MNCIRWNGLYRSDHRPMAGRRYAYRVLWEKQNEPLGELILHHTCENVWCVNLDHLKAMTKGEHSRIHNVGREMPRWQSEKTHCARGHIFTVGNTRLRQRDRNDYKIIERRCIECAREDSRASRERLKTRKLARA